MKIGFDLDKVFIDYPPLVPDAVIDRLYKKKSNGTLSYRFPSKPEIFLRKFSHFPIFRPCIKENMDFLKSIPRKNNKIYLISSRYGFLKKETEEILKQRGLDKLFDGIFFNFENYQPHIFKDQKINMLKLDIYVDDDFSLLKYVAKKNKKTKFFWLNSKTKPLHLTRNIFAINVLPDILS